MFKKNVSTFERTMTGFLAATVSQLVQEFIKSIWEKNCKICALLEGGKQYFYFLSALYAIDVKFHHINRPHGDQMDSKLYFSGKHYLYGYKVQVPVSPLGFVVFFSEHCPGSAANLSIFRTELASHVLLSAKDASAKDNFDVDGNGRRLKHWEILFDEGYTEAQREARAIIPKKKEPQAVVVYDGKEKKC